MNYEANSGYIPREGQAQQYGNIPMYSSPGMTSESAIAFRPPQTNAWSNDPMSSGFGYGNMPASNQYYPTGNLPGIERDQAMSMANDPMKKNLSDPLKEMMGYQKINGWGTTPKDLVGQIGRLSLDQLRSGNRILPQLMQGFQGASKDMTNAYGSSAFRPAYRSGTSLEQNQDYLQSAYGQLRDKFNANGML